MNMLLTENDLTYLVGKTLSLIKENSNDRKANAWVKQNLGLTDFNEIREVIMGIYKVIPYSRVEGGKYLPGVMRYVFIDRIPRDEYPLLNKFLYIIKTNYPLQRQFDTDFNGLSFSELKTQFKSNGEKQVEPVNYVEKRRRAANGYTITQIDNFREMEMATDGEWCISNSKSDWDDIVGYSNVTVYLVENENLIDEYDAYYEKHREEAIHKKWDLDNKTEDDEWEMPQYGSGEAPYDAYGLSRFVVIVSKDGHLSECYSRYNLPNLADGYFLNERQLEEMLGGKFEVLFPYVKHGLDW